MILQPSPQLTKQNDEGNDVREVIKLRSRRFEVLNTDDISATLTKMADDIQVQICNSYLQSSDVVFDNISKITIYYGKYDPTRAGSYIELLKWVSSKKACINIRNEDNKCSKYCVQCSVFKTYEKDSPERMRRYNTLNGTSNDWGCMKFPCSRKDIDRFEEESQGSISVSVYKLPNETTITNRITKVENAEHQINLSMVEKEDNHHYVLIKDLSKMVGCQYNGNTKKKQIRHHCLRVSINRHIGKHIGHGCLAVEGQRIQMPKEGEQIYFKNQTRKFEAPYVMYAGFECLTMEYSFKIYKPIDPNISYTEKYQHHKPCGCKIHVVNRTTNESESYLYRGSDCMEHFVKTCRNIKDKIMNELKVNVPIIMTEEDEDNFKQCYTLWYLRP